MPAGRRRVNVYFSADAWSALEEVSARSGRSLSEVLRDAIKLLRYVHEIRAQGGHLLIETASGAMREVISL